MRTDPYQCAQCGRRGATMRAITLPDGGWAPVRSCTDKQACRDRWWARVAYELELAPQ